MKNTFCTSNLWIWNQFAFIIVNHDSICALNQTEIFMTHQDKGYRILQVEDMRSVPVGNIVDVTLRSCSCNEVIISNTHVNDSVLEVQIFLKLDIIRKNVGNFNSILSIQICLPVVVSYLLINNFTKYHVSISTSSWT